MAVDILTSEERETYKNLQEKIYGSGGALGSSGNNVKGLFDSSLDNLMALAKNADDELKKGVDSKTNASSNTMQLMVIQHTMHAYTSAFSTISTMLKKIADNQAGIIQRL